MKQRDKRLNVRKCEKGYPRAVHSSAQQRLGERYLGKYLRYECLKLLRLWKKKLCVDDLGYLVKME